MGGAPELLTRACCRVPRRLLTRSLEALQSYQRCGGRFSGSDEVFALAEVVRGLARCGRHNEVRGRSDTHDTHSWWGNLVPSSGRCFCQRPSRTVILDSSETVHFA